MASRDTVVVTKGTAQTIFVKIDAWSISPVWVSPEKDSGTAFPPKEGYSNGEASHGCNGDSKQLRYPGFPVAFVGLRGNCMRLSSMKAAPVAVGQSRVAGNPGRPLGRGEMMPKLLTETAWVRITVAES